MTADLLSASWDPGDAGVAGVWLPGGFEVEYAEPGGPAARPAPARHGSREEGQAMRLWHLPAHPLPVVTRPIAGETLPSYARRLAAANDLAPYAILRALGQLRTGPGKHLLVCDARINEQAAARL